MNFSQENQSKLLEPIDWIGLNKERKELEESIKNKEIKKFNLEKKVLKIETIHREKFENFDKIQKELQ